jgi:regulator of cell morphogenesis and NO signaling
MTTTLAPTTDAFARRPLGELAREIPGATAVLRRHRLDFCCGGARTLGDAARERDLDADAIAAELRALAPAADDAPEGALPLIDHILVRYHETHRRELPELVVLARRVEGRHAQHPEVPRGLADLLEDIAEALDEHMVKEEQVLFPMMRGGMGTMASGPIEVMKHEHDEHGRRLRELEALTRDHVPPADACNSWRALYAGTAKLVDDVMQHIHLENNVLFPQFGVAID